MLLNVLSIIDNFLDRITMYRLLLYYLIALIVIATGLSSFGILHFNPLAIIVTTGILLLACRVINKMLAVFLQASTNVESVYITALILALIITPLANYSSISIAFLLAVSGLAMASKYILAIGRKHIFNPAAIAVALTALGPHQSASWWVGTTPMMPFVVLGGILLVRKIRRGRMVLTFLVTSLMATTIYTLVSKGNVVSVLDKTVLTSALFFLAFVMLTEPLTTPPTAKKQTLYAILAGILFPPQVHILGLYSTPELVLVASNIFSYLVSSKVKLFPILRQKVRITPDSADFVFNPNRRFNYSPGQYMEWTLPHDKTDSRGNRRYFTLASSPTEPDIRIGVKFYKQGSSYKEALLEMSRDNRIIAAQLSGDFVLPKNKHRKLVFIAGGIGITPFRSMAKYLIDTKEHRTVTMLYSARTVADLAYRDVFEQARAELGINTVYTITAPNSVATGSYTRTGYITAAMIRQEVPDYKQRYFYISGAHSMVMSVQDVLSGLGIPDRQVKVDYFSGYA